MKSLKLSIVALSVFATAAYGQEESSSSSLNTLHAKVRKVAYEKPVDAVLGNPFDDEATSAPASTSPVVTPAPPLTSIVQAPTQLGVSAPCCPDAQACNTCAPSCGNSCGHGCNKGCGKRCGASNWLAGCGLLDCNLGDAYSISNAFHGDCPPCVNVGGWLSAGYHSENNGLFNNRAEELVLHQAWLYAEKKADACSNPLGFRVDAMYGIDARQTQAFGNPSGSWDYDNGFDHGAYGWALPQAYLELAVGNWNIKAGHFFTVIGYEAVGAPNNFFYSHSMSHLFSEPFTHTGVLASRQFGDATVYGGWTLGWDSGFDQVNSGNSWLGGVTKPLCEDITFTYLSSAGNFGARGSEAYSHSVLFDTDLTDSLNWVVQSDLVRVGSTGEDSVGINQYFLYSVSDCLGLGARVEWWKGDRITGYAPHGGTVPAAGSYSNYAATFGANIRPHANLVLRPEVRIDWSPAADYDETYLGVDAVLTF